MLRTLAFSLLAVFFLASCEDGDGNSDKIYGYNVDSVVVDTAVHLTSDAHSPQCELHICLRYIHDEKSLNDSLLSSGFILPEYFPTRNLPVDQLASAIAQKCIDSYRQQFTALYESDRSNANQYHYIYKVYTETLQGPDSTLCYVAQVLTGNAGEQEWQTTAKNFKLPSGHLLTLDDIFVPGYNNSLLRIITAKLMKQFHADSEEDLKEKGVFANEEPYLPDNFIYSKRRIVFFYAPDEVAPHNAGELRIEVSRNEIKELLKQQ